MQARPTVVEAVLAATGAVARTGRVEDGTTVSDHDEVEHRLGRSVSLTVASTVHGDVTINLIDTPGHADFVGEVRAGLRAADAALFVVSAVDGVDGATRLLWEECAGIELPRAVVVTTSTPAAATTTRSSRSVGDSSAPGCSPSTCRCSTTRRSRPAWIGLLSRTVVDLSTGRRVVRPADPEHLSAVEEPRSTLIEGIIQESEDDSLLDRWLEGEEVALDTLIADLETAVARGSFHPVLPCNPLTGLGVTELLEVIVSGFPSPVEHPLPA